MTEVRLINLSKTFGHIKAVNNITITVHPGELFFLLGPSGCGKTTVLRLIAGFYTPDTGEIYFNNTLMNNIKPNKRNTAMVFQNYALWPHMTVKQNITYGLDIRKIKEAEKTARLTKILEIVKMSEYVARKPAQLSGGEQQRIALARAIIVDPAVLLFDEPLSNLDAKLRTEMREEIKSIHKKTGITSIYVTHDQKEALSMADRIAVMNKGRIEQIDTPEKIYNNPKNVFVASFIGDTNLISSTVIETTSAGTVIETSFGKLLSTQKINKRDIICSIRPETIEINPMNLHSQINLFDAIIASTTYLGEVIQYQLILNDGTKLKAVGYEKDIKNKVRIYIPAEKIVLLAD